MYRLREERLKAHYGKKEVVDDILNPLSEEQYQETPDHEAIAPTKENDVEILSGQHEPIALPYPEEAISVQKESPLKEESLQKPIFDDTCEKTSPYFPEIQTKPDNQDKSSSEMKLDTGALSESTKTQKSSVQSTQNDTKVSSYTTETKSKMSRKESNSKSEAKKPLSARVSSEKTDRKSTPITDERKNSTQCRRAPSMRNSLKSENEKIRDTQYEETKNNKIAGRTSTKSGLGHKRSPYRLKNGDVKAEKMENKRISPMTSPKRKPLLDQGRRVLGKADSPVISSIGDNQNDVPKKFHSGKYRHKSASVETNMKKSPERERIISVRKSSSRERNPMYSRNRPQSNGNHSKSPEKEEKECSIEKPALRTTMNTEPLKSAMKPKQASKAKERTAVNSDKCAVSSKVDEIPRAVGTEEDIIIKELNNLDDFLRTHRSISQDDSLKKKESESSDAIVNPAGAVDEKLDVMKSGEEKPFIKKIYKYDCPDDDEKHDHYRHPDERVKDKKDTEKSKTVPDRSISEIENEIIEEAILNKLTKKPSNKDIIATRKRSNDSFQPRKTSTGFVEEEIVMKASKATTFGSPKKGNSSDRKDSVKLRPEAFDKTSDNRDRKHSLTKKVERFSPSSASRLARNKERDRDKEYEDDIMSRPSVFDAPKEKQVLMRKIFSNSSACESKIAEQGTDKQLSTHRQKTHSKRKGSAESSTVGTNNEKNMETKTGETAGSKSKVGKVLRTKNLFETTQEELENKKVSESYNNNPHRTSKVSKRAAFFEARARGEKQSVESLTSSIIAEKTEKNEKLVNTTDMEKSTIQHVSQTDPHLTRRDSTPRKNKSKSPSSPGKNNTTKDNYVNTDQKSPTRRKSSIKKDKPSKTESNDNSCSTHVQLTPDPADIDSIEELEKLLDSSADYGERSKIRTKIRLLKRQSRLQRNDSNDDKKEAKPERLSSSEITKPQIKQQNITTVRLSSTKAKSGEIAALSELENKENRYAKTNMVSIMKKSNSRRRSWESRESHTKTTGSYNRKNKSDSTFSHIEKVARKSSIHKPNEPNMTQSIIKNQDERNAAKRSNEASFGKRDSVRTETEVPRKKSTTALKTDISSPSVEVENKFDNDKDSKDNIKIMSQNTFEFESRKTDKRKSVVTSGDSFAKREEFRDSLTKSKSLTEREDSSKEEDISMDTSARMRSSPNKEIKPHRQKAMSNELFSTRHVAVKKDAGLSGAYSETPKIESKSPKAISTTATDKVCALNETKMNAKLDKSKNSMVTTSFIKTRLPEKDSKHGSKDPAKKADVSTVTSSYGVGPTDEQGKIFWFLIAHMTRF